MQAEQADEGAMSLLHCISWKTERIKDEFTERYSNPRLNDTEAKRMEMFEDLQTLERVQRDYENMKMMMEVKIKDFPPKMDIME